MLDVQSDDGRLAERSDTEFAIDRLAGEMRAGFSRLERKLDQFIDTQSKSMNSSSVASP